MPLRLITFKGASVILTPAKAVVTIGTGALFAQVLPALPGGLDQISKVGLDALLTVALWVLWRAYQELREQKDAAVDKKDLAMSKKDEAMLAMVERVTATMTTFIDGQRQGQADLKSVREFVEGKNPKRGQ